MPLPLRRRVAPDLALILLLLIAPLLMFHQQTLGGRTLLPSENLFQHLPYSAYREVARAPATPHNHLLSDMVLQNFQWKSFIRAQIAQGELPLWNPHQFAGVPFFAAGQHSALYPLSFIYYILPLSAAYGWFILLNLWLAGMFMAGFMRALGRRARGRRVGGRHLSTVGILDRQRGLPDDGGGGGLAAADFVDDREYLARTRSVDLPRHGAALGRHRRDRGRLQYLGRSY